MRVTACVVLLVLAAQAKADEARPSGHPLYVGIALGGGGLHDHISGFFNSSGRADGAVIGGHVMVGAAVIPHLAVGGAITIDSVPSPDVEVNGTKVKSIDVGALVWIGPFVDWDLARGGTGFHLLGGLGFSRVTVTDSNNRLNNHTPEGVALLLGGGYDWRLSAQWRIGGLLRVMLGSLSDSGIDHTPEMAMLMVSLTRR
jgi:hypothetical protein